MADPNATATGRTGYTSTPVPDPTVLTTAALYREVAALKELIEQRVETLVSATDAAHAAIEQTIREAVDARTAMDGEVQKRTDLQFTLVEQQRIEQKADTKAAVDAALTAQKEAIAKTEAATNKQLEDLGKRFETAVENLRRATDEVKERVGELDRSLTARISEVATTANAYGQQKQGGTDSRAVIGWGLAAVLSVITIGAVLVAAVKP